MRKQARKLLLLIMALMAVMSFGITSKAAVENKLDVNITLGFDDNYKIGYSTPVTLNINNTYKDINGEVEIRVPSTPGKYVSYVKPISIEKDAEKVITINVPVGASRTKYSVYINNGKERVFEDTITFSSVSNTITQFIGMLSDDFDSITYINKIPANSGMTVMTKNIKLNEKNFPEDIFTLKSFDLIVINNFDTSKLSKAQYEMLKLWVRDGGTLLVGTGTSHAKTHGIFKDDFIQGSAGTVKTVSTSKISNIATNGDTQNNFSVEALAMEIKDASTVIEDKGVKLAQVLKKGSGFVGIAAFDFGQSSLAGWANNTSFVEKLISSVNPNMVSEAAMKGMPYEQTSYMVRDVINQFSEMASIKTSNFYLILFIYILGVAPISYIVLKKLDKREYMWVTVPVLSIAFGFIVYLSGTGTRLNKVTSNVASILNIDERGNASASTYAGIFSTKKSKLTVKTKEGDKLIPVSDPYYRDPNMVIQNEDLEARVLADGGGVEYHNSGILQTKMVQIQKNSSNIGKIETDIRMKDGSLTGTIKNSTNIDLEDCYIITPGEYYKLDSLKSGESKTLSGSSGSYGGNIHQFIENTIAYRMYTNPSTMSESARKEAMERNQKASMLRIVYMRGAQKVEGVKLIAFSKSSMTNPLIINGKEAAKNERTLLAMPLQLNFQDGQNITYPKGFVPYTMLQSGALKYDPYGGRLMGIGAAEFIYNIDQKMKIEEVQLGTFGLSYGGTKPLVYIFNYSKNDYEEASSDTLTGDALSKYIGTDNRIKLKIELKGGGDSTIPQISAKGKVK